MLILFPCISSVSYHIFVTGIGVRIQEFVNANTSIVLLKGWLIFWEKVLTADEKAKAAPAAKSKEKVKEKAQAAKEKKKAAKDSTYVIQCVVFLAGDLLLFSNARVHLKQISFKYE